MSWLNPWLGHSSLWCTQCGPAVLPHPEKKVPSGACVRSGNSKPFDRSALLVIGLWFVHNRLMNPLVEPFPEFLSIIVLPMSAPRDDRRSCGANSGDASQTQHLPESHCPRVLL